ncbi:MAG: peptidase C39 family protein [Nanoarchaeota archaeon]|nr:peptidase C39 family protein [Nanoarchaeota archaeon]
MKLNVPFYLQEPKECGPTALRMILAFFGEDHSVKTLSRLAESEETGNTWMVGLAKASTELGFSTKYFSKILGFNPANYELKYYQKETKSKSESEKLVEHLHEKCIKLGVEITKKSLSSEEILSFLSENSIPILLLNWNVIKGKEGYQGHIVPLVGYEGERVYIHQPDPKIKAQEFFSIERQLFEKARRSEGTDEDVIVVYKK